MKKFEEPIVKVVKFKAMDVIATSGDTPQTSMYGLQQLGNAGTDWRIDQN